jgi:hypothetical protein
MWASLANIFHVFIVITGNAWTQIHKLSVTSMQWSWITNWWSTLFFYYQIFSDCKIYYPFVPSCRLYRPTVSWHISSLPILAPITTIEQFLVETVFNQSLVVLRGGISIENR